jgi:hypothetical protein
MATVVRARFPMLFAAVAAIAIVVGFNEPSTCASCSIYRR